MEGGGQHLGATEVQALLALASPRTPLGWRSQLLFAGLDAGVGLLVQRDIAALAGVQVEERVFHQGRVKALLPQLCLLELVGPWGSEETQNVWVRPGPPGT